MRSLEVDDRLLEKFRNSVPKEFMTTPIHVLCSNLKEIGRRKVGETMRCFGDRKLTKCDFSPPFCPPPLAEGTKNLPLCCSCGQT